VESATTIPLDSFYIARLEATFSLPITEFLNVNIPKTVCEFSCEFQRCIFDIFLR
jgi:hypothetical protein